jgi:HK97 gp10 family phage protein
MKMSVDWNGDAVLAKVRAGTMRGVIKATLGVHEEATSLILDTPKTGRIYHRRGTFHRASAAGEPFASDTGATIQSGRTEFDMEKQTGTVHWSTEYAGFLEFGTETMSARPFARPALHNSKDQIEQDIQGEVRNALK